MNYRMVILNAFEHYQNCVRYGKEIKSWNFTLYTKDYLSIKVYEYENQIYIFKMENGDIISALKIGE